MNINLVSVTLKKSILLRYLYFTEGFCKSTKYKVQLVGKLECSERFSRNDIYSFNTRCRKEREVSEKIIKKTLSIRIK